MRRSRPASDTLPVPANATLLDWLSYAKTMPDCDLVVCHAGNGSVWIFSPIGQPLYRIKSCRGNFPTNIAYGGPENRTVFITESDTGTILRAELPVPGRTMFSHMD